MNKPAVLIVDDQPQWRGLFSDLLEEEYEVTVAESYEMALNALDRDLPFRVAIVDIRLDDKDRANEDGLRLVTALREKGTNSIVVTGYPTSRNTWAAFSSGASGYIEKNPEDKPSFDVANFREVVRKAVDAFVFVVMPFADKYTAMYDDVIKKTIETMGLACKRADDFHNPSWIMDDVRRCINEARFMVADLSGRNLNVFYEVGMAHAMHQHVILLAQERKDVPPKLRGVRYIEYKSSLSGATKLKQDLSQAVNDLQRKHCNSLYPQRSYPVNPQLCIVLKPQANSVSQEAFESIIKDVASRNGLDCEDTQSIFSTKQIMDAIWDRLNEAGLVVADLSGGDPEVFYLTGISHGLGKNVILLAQNEEDIPFNLRESSHILYATEPYEAGRKAHQEFDRVLKQVLATLAPTLNPDSPTPHHKKQQPKQADEKKATYVEQYADFTLHIGPGGHARAKSEEGERSATIPLSIPTEVELMAGLIEQNTTNEDLLRKFGKLLYEMIFPAPIDTHFNVTEAAAHKENQKVRIRLTIEPDKLAQLPWEFMYRGDLGYFLATNPGTVLSHYLDLSLPQGYVTQHEGPLQMLTIISNPNDQEQLNVERWEQIVRKALAKPTQEGRVTLKFVKQATFEEIQDALREYPPDMVQFVGHGTYTDGKGYIALVNSQTGGTWGVDDTQFAAFFADVQNRLGLVCLATCESAKSDSPKSFLGIAPKIVQRGVPAVVAMRYPVLVSTAEVFLEEFYKNLAVRKPVDWAVQSARNALAIKFGFGNREFATPVLFMRAKDGNIF